MIISIFAIILFISVNAQAAENTNDAAFFEKNFPSSGKTAPLDYDSFYSIPLSKNEKINILGNVDFEPSQLSSNQSEASLMFKYSMNF
jgi:hypothetical protein